MEQKRYAIQNPCAHREYFLKVLVHYPSSHQATLVGTVDSYGASFNLPEEGDECECIAESLEFRNGPDLLADETYHSFGSLDEAVCAGLRTVFSCQKSNDCVINKELRNLYRGMRYTRPDLFV